MLGRRFVLSFSQVTRFSPDFDFSCTNRIIFRVVSSRCQYSTDCTVMWFLITLLEIFHPQWVK
jgi:predicted nucleotidyltransferase component of viral defense system